MNLLDEFSHQLQKMEETEEVDTSVVDTIDKLIDACHSTESFWRDNEKVTIQCSFLLYHASRNVRIVLEKMMKRFIEAKEKHENPSVVHDSLALLPVLGDLCETVSSLTKQTISKEMLNMVSEKVEYLRDAALANSLLPTPEEEIGELDRELLKKRFCQFADTLQAMSV